MTRLHRFCAPLFALAVPLSAQAGPAATQAEKRLTLERVATGPRAVSFRPATPSAVWRADGTLLLTRPEPKGVRRTVVDPATLAESEAQKGAETPPKPAVSLELEKGEVFLRTPEGESRKLSATAGCSEAHLAPDGKHASWVAGNDLFVAATDGSGVWRVTDDGGKTVFNGLLDWVYQEELYGRGDFQGHWWSPDSGRVAFLRLDETAVKDFTVIDHVPTPRLDDERAVVAEVTKYPKAGDPNPLASLHVADVATRRRVAVDLSRWKPEDELLVVRVTWTPNGDRVIAQIQNRIQTWLELVAIDPSSGSVTPILKESSPTWVNVIGQPQFLADGSFLWFSDRSGYQNLYRYSLDGKLLATLSDAKFVISGVERVDEAAGQVWLTGRGESALDSHLYRVGLDGQGFVRLTDGAGSHAVKFSPDGSQFLDTHSSLSTPPELRLCRADGTIAARWASTPAPAIAEYGVRMPELVQVRARDGYLLDATVLVPDQAPATRRPIWIDTYSGPDAPTVRNAYRVSGFHQFLRQQGVIVLQVNVRSASGRGQVATGTCYKQMLVQELADLEDAVQWVCAERGGDPARVGITGYSYGGSMTAYALTHSQAFALGVAGAGVYDWQLYDTIYTERYMQTPQLNPEGYAKTSVIAAARHLHGRLILVHGTMDDNVHLQGTMRLAHALQMAGKDFEMMLYPKSRHGIGSPAQSQHLQRLTWRAIQETLLGKPEAAGAAAPKPADGGDAPVGDGGDDPAAAPLRALAEFARAQGIDTSKDGWRLALPKPPQQAFPAGREYVWNLVTNVGEIRVKLLPAVAPMHVTSTIYLTQLGFYDGLVFHRVIPGFMAQGGCPRGVGNGGPGYQYAGEFDPAVRHQKGGLLSMANAGPGTDGSQFFLTFKATPWLDDKHTIFGEVVAGLDVLGELEKAGSSGGRTTKRLEILRATIDLR
ncbi:MAG: DPP IV N-terminal domain-containing protein [Planctomycetes bacterium]|nr:DPP IV N-terminal domain-containing protein [Planctomycetota bacterium]